GGMRKALLSEAMRWISFACAPPATTGRAAASLSRRRGTFFCRRIWAVASIAFVREEGPHIAVELDRSIRADQVRGKNQQCHGNRRDPLTGHLNASRIVSKTGAGARPLRSGPLIDLSNQLIDPLDLEATGDVGRPPARKPSTGAVTCR